MATPSTQLITDLGTVATNGPNSATKAKSLAAAGKIMGYPDNVALAIQKLKESYALVTLVIADTDSTDTANLALLQNVQASLV